MLLYAHTEFFFKVIPPSNILLSTLSAYIQMHFKLDFIMETNTMTPDQTAQGAV